MADLFRKHNDGTLTDVYDDESCWVRDGEASSVRDLRDPDMVLDAPTTFDGLRAFFVDHQDIEGVPFVHPDGREAEVHRSEFAL